MIELNSGEEFTKEELAVFNEQYLAMFKNLAEMKKQKDALDKQEKDIKARLEAAMDEYAIIFFASFCIIAFTEPIIIPITPNTKRISVILY